MTRKRRRQFLIDPSFQIRFILKFCVLVIVASLLICGSTLFITRDSTTVAIENTKVLAKLTSDFILPSLLITTLIVLFFSAIVVIILTLFMSHKISGPIFRLKEDVDLMRKGNLTQNFSIRSKDQLQALANSLSLMADTFKAKHSTLKDSGQALKNYLEERNFRVAPDDKEEILKILKDINDTLSYFEY